MSVFQKVNEVLSSPSNSVSEIFERQSMTESERIALEDAERLADQFSDIKPSHLVVSGKHLFSLPN